MNFETIKYEISESIATITVNRPKALNSLNLQVLAELIAAAGSASGDQNVKAIIVTGEGRAFVAGADIAQMQNFNSREGLTFGDMGHALMMSFETMDKPVVAAVNGFALGGGTELALGCDFIYASDRALFGLPEVSLGITPGFGGTQRLSRSIGLNRAREMVFTGKKIKAKEAAEIGLVSEVFASEGFMDAVRDKIKKMLFNGPVAMATAKRVMNKGFDLALDSALELEKQAFSSLFGTEDQKEGMAAFLDKRRADFKGK